MSQKSPLSIVTFQQRWWKTLLDLQWLTLKNIQRKPCSRTKSKVGLKAGVSHLVVYWFEETSYSCHCQKSLPLTMPCWEYLWLTSQSNGTLLIRQKTGILAANQLYLLSKWFSLSLPKQETCVQRVRANLNWAVRPLVSAKQAKGLKLQFGSAVATLEGWDSFLLLDLGKDLARYRIISSFKNKARNWIRSPLKGSCWQNRKAVLPSQSSFGFEYYNLSFSFLRGRRPSTSNFPL